MAVVQRSVKLITFTQIQRHWCDGHGFRDREILGLGLQAREKSSRFQAKRSHSHGEFPPGKDTSPSVPLCRGVSSISAAWAGLALTDLLSAHRIYLVACVGLGWSLKSKTNIAASIICQFFSEQPECTAEHPGSFLIPVGGGLQITMGITSVLMVDLFPGTGGAITASVSC